MSIKLKAVLIFLGGVIIIAAPFVLCYVKYDEIFGWEEQTATISIKANHHYYNYSNCSRDDSIDTRELPGCLYDLPRRDTIYEKGQCWVGGPNLTLCDFVYGNTSFYWVGRGMRCFNLDADVSIYCNGTIEGVYSCHEVFEKSVKPFKKYIHDSVCYDNKFIDIGSLPIFIIGSIPFIIIGICVISAAHGYYKRSMEGNNNGVLFVEIPME
ncbi:MAG: hypothetical protein Hyperionvirus1_19 [Hyperionvirus sp.]|uniref:Uncharacterized protein n=1 Tax=Hyperionvirus sp. TaxID=2487770 RepID=A0A3G5A5B3_9VIRU|nr:MAG: hypothetical protein Hyperionvirus1_19 [Hyperionvirus sp.]